MRKNNTFRGGEPFWANACVGENGMPDYYEYAKGFSEASNILIEAALSNSGCDHAVDIMIYPICFNMRHSVELRLKGAVVILSKLASSRQQLPEFNLEGSHDIGGIWEYLSRELNSFDARLGFFTDALDPFIRDFADIDPTGQTFRYPYSNENIKHLTDIPTINVGILQRVFAALELLLDHFKNFLLEVNDEYALKTHTKRLSRHQILKIASETPAAQEWGTPAFSKFKDRIKATYNIGSKELTEVLNIVKGLYTHRFSPFAPPKLKFLTKDKIEKLFEAWIFINQPEEKALKAPRALRITSDSDSMRDHFAIAIEKDRRRESIWDDLAASFSKDELADLTALYEVGDSNYAEHYPFNVEYYQAEFKDGSYSYDGGTNETLLRLIKKSRALQRMIKTLFLTGQYSLADSLAEKYSHVGNLDWLQMAREDQLFIEPCETIKTNCAMRFKELVESFDS